MSLRTGGRFSLSWLRRLGAGLTRWHVGQQLTATAALLVIPLCSLVFYLVRELDENVAEGDREMAGFHLARRLGDVSDAWIRYDTGRGPSFWNAAVKETSRARAELASKLHFAPDEFAQCLNQLDAVALRDDLDWQEIRELLKVLMLAESAAGRLNRSALDEPLARSGLPSILYRDIPEVLLLSFETRNLLAKLVATTDSESVDAVLKELERSRVLFSEYAEAVSREAGIVVEALGAKDRLGPLLISFTESGRSLSEQARSLADKRQRLSFLEILGQNDFIGEGLGRDLGRFSREAVAFRNAVSALRASLIDTGIRRLEAIVEEIRVKRSLLIWLVVVAVVVSGLLGYFIIKNQRYLHRTLAARNEGLEEMVRARVAEIEASRQRTEALNRDLADQKRTSDALANQARQAERAKSEFLANMSHEIRTPMNGVVGMTHLLSDTHLDATQRSYLNTMSKSMDSLMILIDDILDFSKIEAGKMRLENSPLDLSVLVEDLGRLFAGSAAKKRIELACHYPLGCRYAVLGDPHRLQQVLSNLLSNAIKFTEAGGVTLEVSYSSVSLAEAMVKFSVRDSGIGISDTAIGKLFAAFSQADASTTRKFGGTGLGLAISSRLVEMMGGTLRVESVQGKGSCFSFDLRMPISEVTAATDLSDEHKPLLGRRFVVCCGNSWVWEELDALLLYLGGETLRTNTLGDLGRLLEEEPASCLAVIDGSLYDASALHGRLLPPARLLVLRSLGTQGDGAWDGLAAIARPLSPRSLLRGLQAFDPRARELDGGKVEATAAATSSRIQPLGARFAHATILLVDDNETNRLIGGEILRKLGIEVEFSQDGRDALERLSERRYDAVLLDCMMPDIDGYEVAERIRRGDANGLNVSSPIIALTANAMDGDREKCIAAGMSDYLSKPLQPALLREKLDYWLGKPN